MKKMFFICAVMLLASSHASAVLLGSITNDYGSGKYDPAGSDLATTNAVLVSELSTNPFNDMFDFSSIGGSVSWLQLVLEYDDAGPRTGCFSSTCGISLENWTVVLQGSGSSADLSVGLSDVLSPQTISLSSATNSGAVDVWSYSLGQQSLSFNFFDDSTYGNEFALNSATLNVFGEVDDGTGTGPVSVPEPSSMALFGLGLAGVVAARRRKAA